jgi:hypothetical protein
MAGRARAPLPTRAAIGGPDKPGHDGEGFAQDVEDFAQDGEGFAQDVEDFAQDEEDFAQDVEDFA